MVDRISSRRVAVNSLFVSINMGMLAFISYVNLGKESGTASWLYAPLSAAGAVLCCLWYRLIKSYRELNHWKHNVLYELEKKLPARPYYVQGQYIRGDGGKMYKPFTYIEVWVPWVFLLIHAGIAIYCVPWAFLWKFCSWVRHVW